MLMVLRLFGSKSSIIKQHKHLKKMYPNRMDNTFLNTDINIGPGRPWLKLSFSDHSSVVLVQVVHRANCTVIYKKNWEERRNFEPIKNRASLGFAKVVQ